MGLWQAVVRWASGRRAGADQTGGGYAYLARATHSVENEQELPVHLQRRGKRCRSPNKVPSPPCRGSCTSFVPGALIKK